MSPVETCYWPEYKTVTVQRGSDWWQEVQRHWCSEGFWKGRSLKIDHFGLYDVNYPLCSQHDLFADTIWGTISGFVTCDNCRDSGWGPDVGEDWAEGLKPSDGDGGWAQPRRGTDRVTIVSPE